MLSLREKLADPNRFLIGVELVSTRGTMEDRQAIHTRDFSGELVNLPQIDWVSITDNAGGNPQLSPMALGKPILYSGKDKEVLIHLSCKDFNRNGLESAAWELSSEGFHNILALSGDYPAAGYHGRGKPVFDIDSIGLLTMLDEMNRGLARPKMGGGGGGGAAKADSRIQATSFFAGAVATNFKKLENEVVPQLLKLDKKVQCGAKFIIAQIGYDSRKSHEMLCYMRQPSMGGIPLIGNVFLLTAAVARFFRKRTIPGVVISDALFAQCEKHAMDGDRGAAYFRELAAKQLAIFRGLGFAGGYVGGVHNIRDVEAILDLEATFSRDDWKTFAREIRYPVENEFYYFAENEQTSLADPTRLEPQYADSLRHRAATHNVTLGYRLNKWVHDAIFTPGTELFNAGKALYQKSPDPTQGPRALRILEHAGKSAMFGCKDCGDCSLPDIAFLCPESQCAKNQRNGPCGGTRDGKCEVHDFECIWSRAYDRLKYEGREQKLLAHAPVIQDESLRGTSSWANMMLGRDHHGPCAQSPHAPSPVAAADVAVNPAPGPKPENIPMSTATPQAASQPHPPSHPPARKLRPFKLIGELINNSFARATKAFRNRDVKGYQHLAKVQSDLGADYLTLNIDGTQSMMVRPQEMFDFLPDLIPAIQEVTDVPLSFDNPSIEFHKRCLKIYDRSKARSRPILNSVAASRTHLDEMFELVKHYDTLVIGMASEKFIDGGSGQCLNADDVYGATERLVHLCREKAGRTNDQVIIDPGLAPVGADTYGLVNMGLDAMKRIRRNPDLKGLHISVGLTNFSFGMPKNIREKVESAYLTLAVEAGLDFVLGNPEKDLRLLDPHDRFVIGIADALECGRPGEGETQEEAGFRQAAKIIDLFNEHDS